MLNVCMRRPHTEVIAFKELKRWRINRNQVVSKILRNGCRRSNLSKVRSARRRIQNEKEKDGVRAAAKSLARSNLGKVPINQNMRAEYRS